MIVRLTPLLKFFVLNWSMQGVCNIQYLKLKTEIKIRNIDSFSLGLKAMCKLGLGLLRSKS